MSTVVVVVGDVLDQDSFEVPAAEDQPPIKSLTADGADEALGEGVGPGRPNWRANDADAVSSEDLVEARRELGLSVTDQDLDGVDSIQRHFWRGFSPAEPSRTRSDKR